MKILGVWTSASQWMTWEFSRQFILIAVPVGVAAALVIFSFYHLDVQMVEKHLRNTEHHHLDMREAAIREHVDAAISGLRLLMTMYHSHGFLSPEAPKFRETLSRSFLAFCHEFTHFRQIRSLTASGGENFRVPCPGGLNAPELELSTTGVLDPDLNRSLAVLGPHDVYISGFHAFNESNGSENLAVPIPVIRFAARPGAQQAGKGAFLVIDVDLRHLISDIMLDTGQGGTMILVDGSGRFVRKPLGEEDWGETLRPGNEALFESTYPEVWQKLSRSQDGVLETSDGLFTYTTMNLAEILQAGTSRGASGAEASIRAPVWQIVSHVPHAEISAGRQAFVMKSILLIPAPLLVTFYLAHIAMRRRRTARDLEVSERYLRQIMDSVADGIVTTDQSGRIERANAATVALFRFGSLEAIPKDIAQFLPLKELAPEGGLAKLWHGQELERRLASEEHSLPRTDGSKFPAELMLMAAELGGEPRFIWIIRDISERQAFEAKQDAARMSFFHQTKMAEIGLIAAGIMHEVGNPIAALSGIVSQLSEEAEMQDSAWGEHARERLKMVAYQADRLAGITREISDFVRTRPGVIELFDLNSLIRSTTRLVQFDARWRHIRLELKLDPGIPAIMGVQDQIAQLLMNLLVNAADAIQDKEPGDRVVSVSTETRPAHILLAVSDNGHGMGEEAKRQAFDSFFTTKPEGKGTGLGLSLCLTIVSAHWGSIEIDSAEGKGAVFQVSLPIPEQNQALTG